MKERNINELFEEYQGFIKLQVNLARRTFYMSREDFEDCIQEANIAFLKAINTFDRAKNASFDTYASTVIKNRIIDYMRVVCRNNSHMVDNEEVISFAFETVSDNSISGHTAFSQAEFIASLESIIKNDSSKTMQTGAKAIVLIMNNYSYQEIAQILNMKEVSIRSAVSMVRKNYANL